MRQLTLSVVLRAANHMTGPLREVVRGIGDVNRAAKQSEGLRQLATNLSRVGEGMQKVGALSLGAGFVGAAALGLKSLPRDVLEAKHALRGIGNVAGANNAQLAQTHRIIAQISQDTNQLQGELVEGLGVLTGKNMALAEAMAALPSIGKTATAQQAEVSRLAETVFAVQQNLGRTADGSRAVLDVAKVLNVAAAAGQAGAFELKDMAQHFPALTGAAQTLGMRGVPAVAQLGAALQIALRQAGDSSQAANNIRNFLGAIYSPEVRRGFRTLGVNVEGELAAAARSADPLLHMIRTVERATVGSASKLSALFGDEQARTGARSLMVNLSDYLKIRDAALSDVGTIDRNHAAMMTDTLERVKALRINMAALALPQLDGPLARINAGLGRINANPALQRVVGGGVLAALAGGAGLVAVGTLVRVLAPVATGLGRVWHGAALVRSGFLGAAPAGGAFARGLMRVGGEAALLGPRMRGLGEGIRRVSGIQALAAASQARGGVFNLLRDQAQRAGYVVWWHIASLRAWGAALRGNVIAGVAGARAAVLAKAGAIRTATAARFAHARATAATVFSLRTWTGMVAAVPGHIGRVVASLRSLTLAQVGHRAATMATAVAQGVATAAQWALNAAMYANPVGIVVAATVGAVAIIGVAALTIRKYWAPISGFFRGLWTGLKAGLAPLAPAFRPLIDGASRVGAVFRWIGSAIGAVVRWFGRLITPVDDVGGAAENLGVRWGRALGGMLTFVAGLPRRFMAAGANIVRSLWEGMRSLASRPVELMRQIAQRVRNFLPFSPAREGPLRDIHRIRLVETLASSIRPGPAVAAMRVVAASLALASPIVAPRPAFASFVPTPLDRVVDTRRIAAAASEGRGSESGAAGRVVIHLTYNAAPVTINGGADRDTVAELRRLVREQPGVLERVLADAVDRHTKRVQRGNRGRDG